MESDSEIIKDSSPDNPFLDPTQAKSSDLKSTKVRFYMLFLAGLLCIGNYFVYDNPAALEGDLESVTLTQQLNIGTVEFNMLYSAYSLPNIFLPFFGGILMDKFGVRIVIIISSFLVTIGQAVFAFGVSIGSFYVALLGRGLLGCGGENLDVSQTVIVVKWFAGRELSMALGLNSSMSLIGTVLNDDTEPKIVSSSNSLDLGLWIGFMVCVGSLFSAFFLTGLDKKRDRLLGVDTSTEIAEEKRIKCSDFRKFTLIFWLILINSVIVYCSVYSFMYIASEYYQDRFGYDATEGGNIISIPFTMCLFTIPFIGITIDKVGKRGLFLLIATVLVTSFQILLMVTPDSHRSISPIIYLGVLGFGYAISVTTVWSSIAYTIDSSVLGTANGAVCCAGNIGLVAFPIIVGALKENTERDHGYYWPSFFLACLGVAGIVNCIFIYFYDLNHGGILNSTDPIQARLLYLQSQQKKN